MSGLEIAGVVLGAIPLVISAIEHYEDVTTPMKVFLRFNGEVSKVIRQLGNLRVSYELSLKVVLQPVVNDQELSDMMENPESELWQNAEIEASLRSSLGEAYNAYRRTAEDIEGVIVEILDSLNIQDFNTASGEKLQDALAKFTKRSKTSKFQITGRIKYSKSRKRIQTRLDDIRGYIALLDSYETKAAKIAAPETKTSPSRFKFALPLRMLQSNAAKLYDVLSNSWCSDHSSHSAGLLLEQRIVASKRGRQQQDTSDTGRFEISYLQTPAPKKKWLDVEFRMVERDPKALPPKKSQVQVVITTTNVTEPLPPYKDPIKLQVVKDLCLALERHNHPCSGFCFDDAGCLRGSYAAQRTRPQTYHDGDLSLQDLIQQSSYQLSLKDKYNLSITLTSALLQLSPTPWLYEAWNKSDIFFLRANDNQMSDVPVDITHPYLIHEHTGEHAPHARQHPLVKNDSSKLLALGVMLVEILNGQPIESTRQPEALGPNNEPNQFTDFQAIRRWLMIQESQGSISLSCCDAIQYCLECFVKPTARISDEEFAGTVLEKILMPLAMEYNSMFVERSRLAKV